MAYPQDIRAYWPNWAGTRRIMIANRTWIVYKSRSSSSVYCGYRRSLALINIMSILRLLSAVTVLATTCVARPTSNVDFEKTVVEKLEAAPVGWLKDSSAKLDKDATSITLKVHLVNQDMDKFHDLAMNVRSSREQQSHGLKLISMTDCNSWSRTVREPSRPRDHSCYDRTQAGIK